MCVYMKPAAIRGRRAFQLGRESAALKVYELFVSNISQASEIINHYRKSKAGKALYQNLETRRMPILKCQADSLKRGRSLDPQHDDLMTTSSDSTPMSKSSLNLCTIITACDSIRRRCSMASQSRSLQASSVLYALTFNFCQTETLWENVSL